MEIPRLNRLSLSLKWALTVYLILTCLGFAIAGFISHDRYGFEHERTQVYFLGSEAEMAYPKLYGQLIQTVHVHSFSMPLLFLAIWLGLSGVALKRWIKMTFIFGGGISILVYNAAPFLVRYHSPKWVSIFSIGGVGLFLFYCLPALIILWEIWIGLRDKRNPLS